MLTPFRSLVALVAATALAGGLAACGGGGDTAASSAGASRTVTDVDEGEPRPGMTWRDVTKVGLKPSMEITELTPYRVIGETGTWRGVDGLLTLRFVKTTQGTRLTAEGRLIGHGPYALAPAVSGRWAPETIRKDLLRASEILATP